MGGYPFNEEYSSESFKKKHVMTFFYVLGKYPLKKKLHLEAHVVTTHNTTTNINTVS